MNQVVMDNYYAFEGSEGLDFDPFKLQEMALEGGFVDQEQVLRLGDMAKAKKMNIRDFLQTEVRVLDHYYGLFDALRAENGRMSEIALSILKVTKIAVSQIYIDQVRETAIKEFREKLNRALVSGDGGGAEFAIWDLESRGVLISKNVVAEARKSRNEQIFGNLLEAINAADGNLIEMNLMLLRERKVKIPKEIANRLKSL